MSTLYFEKSDKFNTIFRQKSRKNYCQSSRHQNNKQNRDKIFRQKRFIRTQTDNKRNKKKCHIFQQKIYRRINPFLFDNSENQRQGKQN